MLMEEDIHYIWLYSLFILLFLGTVTAMLSPSLFFYFSVLAAVVIISLTIFTNFAMRREHGSKKD